MSKINTSNWKYFSMKSLGFSNYHGKRLTKKDRLEGSIPLITAGSENQGIAQFIGNDCKTFNDCITIDMFGNVFYHDYECTGDDNIYFFINNNLSSKEKLFIVSSLNSINEQKYAFKDQFRQDDADSLKVKLPVNLAGEPDWIFMSDFIDRENEENVLVIEKLNNVKNKNSNNLINENWKEFEIGSLFPNIISPKVYHTKDVKKSDVGIPYVVRSKYNNGVKYIVEKTTKIVPNPGGVISFGAENATFFYQEDEFVSGRDMYYIDTRSLSKWSALFVTACLQKITDKYSYNYGLFPKLLKKELVKLPVNSVGEPDWNYMEQYMKNLISYPIN